MPAVWDPTFRKAFYARWGRESAVISAQARRVEYEDFEQLLSIKAVTGGTEHYFVDGRRIAVDDDTFLILNAGRRYGSRIDQPSPLHTFSIFFRPRLAEDTWTALRKPADHLLDNPQSHSATYVEFDERLRDHDRAVTPALLCIRQSLDSNDGDDLWLEEQLHWLMARMLDAERVHSRSQELIPAAKPATRRELWRRLGLAVNYIHTFYRLPIGLRDMASAAHLSPFHFLRLFTAVYRMTPSGYLNRKRSQAARRLMRDSRMSMVDIAAAVGFGSRTTLFRHVKGSARIRGS